jgi:hypothetical protein
MGMIRLLVVAASIAVIGPALRAEESSSIRSLVEAADVDDGVYPMQPGGEAAGDASLWTVNAGAVILQRSRPQSSLIADVTGVNILNAHDYTFNWAAGPDISVARRIASDGAVEVRYFGVDAWQSRVSGFIPAFFEAPRIPFDSVYTSKLFSTEINLRQAPSDPNWLTWLAGFRWVEVSETLARSAGMNANQTQVNHSTLNQLYGGQIGADMQLWSGNSPLSVDCICKAGLFGNAASNQMTATSEAKSHS